MFYTLRKIVIALFILGIVGAFALAGLIVYWNRAAVYYPAVDFVEVLRIWHDHRPGALGQLAGTPVKIIDPLNIELKTDQSVHVTVRLAGLEQPEVWPVWSKEEMRWRAMGKTNLGELVLRKPVHIGLTFLSDQRSGVGIVYLGETNVNALVARAGIAKVRRDFLKGLPLRAQYDLVRAERYAKENGLGYWQPAPAPAAPETPNSVARN